MFFRGSALGYASSKRLTNGSLARYHRRFVQKNCVIRVFSRSLVLMAWGLTDRTRLERSIRYCAGRPFALGRLHLVGGRLDQILYLPPGPDPADRSVLKLPALEFLDRLARILRPSRIHRHRYHRVFAPTEPLRPLVTARAREDNALAAQTFSPHPALPEKPPVPPSQRKEANRKPPETIPSPPSRWAVLLARIYEVFPLVCPTCQTPLTFIAFLTDPEPISQILVHIGEPTSPPPLHPARGPPQTEFSLGPSGAKQDEVAQESFPDDLNQTPGFDPTEPEPVPEDDFDQTWGAKPGQAPVPPQARPEVPKTPRPYPKLHPTRRSCPLPRPSRPHSIRSPWTSQGP